MVSTIKDKHKNIPNAKERILKAACRVFADKNFDAARVDQIAGEAGVPKSLIYYHFKSKDEILEALLNGFFTAMGDLVKNACKNGEPDQDPGTLFQQRYYKFLSENADLVRVAMAESLHKRSKNPPMLRLLDGFTAILAAHNPRAKTASLQILAARLFFSLIPSASLICLGDTFSDRYGFNHEESSVVFSELLARVHSVLFDTST